MSEDRGYIGFYEKEFYMLSNFSSFAMIWKGEFCLTSEHAYHTEKFFDEDMKALIRKQMSAHDALKVSHEHEDKYRKDWKEVKVGIMKEIIREKAKQHSYIQKKLIDSGDRMLIEGSWKDSFWGWGENKDGENMLGKLWMEVREELRSAKT
jgi:ribA/ribD-fused uncharacterized protein